MYGGLLPDRRLPSRDRFRFGVFELNTRTGELRKAGMRVRLAEQPLRVLVKLLERPGQLVTRDELRHELWSDDTFVDFEQNLNTAIKRLRAALGDSAASPRCIETLPRRGYRLLMTVERIDDAPPVEAPPPSVPVAALPTHRRSLKTLVAASLAIGGVAVLIAASRERPRPVDSRVTQAYLQGRYHQKKGTDVSFARARSLFEEALAVDARHAASHSGLADVYLLDDSLAPEMSFSRARQHAMKAIQLDDRLPDAHASLAFVHHYGDWNWAAAEREFTRAIDLDPDHMRSRRWYAIFLSAMGREIEARRQIQHAIALDPLAIVNIDAAASIMFNARQYEDAAAAGASIEDLDRFDPRGYEHQTLALIQLGRYSEAFALVERALEFSPSQTVLKVIRVMCLVRLGRAIEASAELARLEHGTIQGYVPPVLLAMARAELGDPARALNHLEVAYNRRDPYLVLLHTSPWFDPLRNEPRFRQLHARMKFPQSH